MQKNVSGKAGDDAVRQSKSANRLRLIVLSGCVWLEPLRGRLRDRSVFRGSLQVLLRLLERSAEQ